jgi:hypothetical protein
MKKRQQNYQIINNLTQQVQQLQAENQRLTDLIGTLKFFLNKFEETKLKDNFNTNGLTKELEFVEKEKENK